MVSPQPIASKTSAGGTMCRLCGSPTRHLWVGRLLDTDVGYYECRSCGYVQTEEPHWLERAYASAINNSDTGIIARNLVNARVVLGTLWLIGALDGKVVDFAGGYGLLVRMLRDEGIDAVWSDPYCENLLARGFEHRGESAALVTAFEAFEHFVHPAEELDRMLAIAPSVLLSTEIIATPAPQHDQWWYYGREHGQHVGLFRLESLRKLAESRGKKLVSDGRSHHLITNANIGATRWRLMLRANRLFPRIVAHRISSRTWSDHLALSKGGKGG
jgi:methyltransferase family protein